MRICQLIFVTWFCGSILFPQDGNICFARNRPAEARASQPQSRAGKVSAVDPKIQSILDDFEGLPPELASDVYLQLVENGLARDVQLKTKLLNRAFEKASAAQDDVMWRPWGVSVEETPQGLHAIASEMVRLDRISLQSRVVRELFLIDPRRAKQVFESIQPPYLEPIPCNQSWYFAPDAYYDSLAMVVERGFSTRQISGGLRASYVAAITKNIQSHTQLVPVAGLLDDKKFTLQELGELVPAYARALEDLHGDPLSFYVLMSHPHKLLDEILTLTVLLDSNNMDSRPLLQALRDYLVSNFQDPNCGIAKNPRTAASALPDGSSQFNEEFAVKLLRTNLRPINGKEIKSETGGKAETPLPRWESQTYFQLLAASQALGPPGKQNGDARNIQWLSQADDLVTQLSAWSETSEPETEFFHQKAILVEGLAEKTIGTSIHAKALDGFIAFLEQNSHRQINPVDWFLYAKKLLSTSKVLGNSNTDIEALLNSREPVLRIYARLEILQQSSPKSATGVQAN